MKKNTIDISMELIGISGETRGMALKAMKLAMNDKFEEAIELAKLARENLFKAHRVHADIISKEAQGESYEINTLFIHAQDHFSNALVLIDLLDFNIELFKRTKNIQGGK